jgi:RND family efflux transporter MFP subunit
LQLATSTATRYSDLAATHAVSKQDIDNALAARTTTAATVDGDAASVRQLEQLQAFEQVRAPFDGIISARNAEVGQLVNAGSSTVPQTELFHVVQADRLRVYVDVPEAFEAKVTTGASAELSLDAFPARKLAGQVVRTANAIRPSTRTMQIEIDVDNPTGELFAGSYARVAMVLPAAHTGFVLPVEALLFRKEGLSVATVDDGKVVVKEVRAGRDFGDRIELVQGVTAGDAVIVDPPDSIAAGEPVHVAAPRP